MKINKHLYILLSIVLAISCVSKQPDPQRIIDQTIAAHGGELYQQLNVSFDFRDKHYSAVINQGKFTYTREFTDTVGYVVDRLSNDGFIRTINGEKIVLTSERENAYANSVNSVIYFALLPYRLNDEAVNKAYLGEHTIKGKHFFKIKVTFEQEGGGEDHDDEFIYWIKKDSHQIGYLAYSYLTEGGGMRFREAVNVRTIEGVVFADYINYKPISDNMLLENLDLAFEENQLIKLSEINTENIKIN